MIIEIKSPELEALIRNRARNGQTAEDVIRQALQSSTLEPRDHIGRAPAVRKSLPRLFAESPFKGFDIEFERDPDCGRDVSL